MPSIRNSLFLLGGFFTLAANATPLPKGSNSSPGGPPSPPNGQACSVSVITSTVVRTISDPTATDAPSTVSSTAATSTPTAVSTSEKLPTTGNLPSTENTIAFVAIGRGIQNYSCSAINATPVSTGAIAVLWDYTDLASSDEDQLNTLPGLAVDVAFDPLPLDGNQASLAGLPTASVLGHHFFAADGTPTFNLTAENMILFGNKTATVAAPAGSPEGPDGTGSVAWLQLEAKTNVAAEVSIGLVEAYRVMTAGGNPETTCSSVGTMSIQYAAEYWFYN